MIYDAIAFTTVWEVDGKIRHTLRWGSTYNGAMSHIDKYGRYPYFHVQAKSGTRIAKKENMILCNLDQIRAIIQANGNNWIPINTFGENMREVDLLAEYPEYFL